MKPIRILIIIDVHERDLKECCLVGYHLMAKYGFEVIFSSTKNEISEMIRRKPHVIVLSHLQYKRFWAVVQTAKQMGIKICIMPPEGIPAKKESVLEIYGDPAFVSSVDLFLSWGPEVTTEIEKHFLPERIKTVGCARFDTYHERFLPLFRNKQSFLENYGFNPNLPIVTWVSPGGYLNREVQEILNLTQRVSELGKKAWSQERIKSQRLTFQTIKNFLSLFLKSHPGTMNIGYRPHPLEEREIIQPFLEECPEIKLINAKDPIEETLAYSDVYMGFPCTAALESWVQNPARMSLFVRHPDLKGELDFQRQIMALAEVASDYKDFETKLMQCLNPSASSEKRIQERKEMVYRFLYHTDGKAAERCAQAIAELGSKNIRPKHSLHQAFPFMRMVRNRLLSGDWISLKRQRGHHKYFSPEKIENWLSQVAPLYSAPSKKINFYLDL